jgi:membrane associated rhomboid family serine protease
MIPASVGFQCPEDVRAGARSVRPAVTRYGGRVTRPGPVTYTLIAINVAIFVITSVSNGGLDLFSGGTSAIYSDFALVPPAVAHGEIYRLVTAAFLHYGLLHIGFNMYALYIIGPVVEAGLGRWRYLALYFLSGIGGSILTVAFAGPASQSAGASGAIFGLFGALYVMQRRMGQRSGPILGTIAINLLFTFTIPNISWEGHIGGLVTGTLVTIGLVAAAGTVQSRTRRHVAVIVVAAVLLSAAGLAATRHAQSQCDHARGRDAKAFCAYYDPPAAVGNVAAPAGVLVRQSAPEPTHGGPHA